MVQAAAPSRVVRLEPPEHRTYHYWHVIVPDLINPRGHKSKNHQALFQPLTDYSKLLLRLALKHSGDSPWVMPGKGNKPRFQRTGVPGSRVSQGVGAQLRPHDLRHTVATILGELGVEPHVIDALQNHRLPAEHGRYGHLQRRPRLGLLQAEARGAASSGTSTSTRRSSRDGSNAHIRQAVDGKKQFEEAMKLNMKLGPRSDAHKLAMKRSDGRRSALARERVPA